MKYKRFYIESFSILSIKIITLFLSFVSSVVISRCVEPSEKGIYAIGLTFANTIVQFLYLGLPTAHTYFFAKKEASMSEVLGNSIIFSLFSIIPCIIIYLTIHFFHLQISLTPLQLIIVLCLVPFLILTLFLGQFFLSSNRVKSKNVYDFFDSVLFIILVVSVSYFFNMNDTNLLQISLINTVLLSTTFLGITLIINKCKPVFSLNLLKKSIPVGFLSYICCFISFLILRVDMFMVNSMLGNLETGYYSTAVNLVDILAIISSSVGTLLFPKAASMKNNLERNNFVISVVMTISIILIIISGLAEVFSGFLIPLIYGEPYINSVTSFKILIPGMFFWSIEGLFGNYFAAEKRFVFSLISMVIAFVINIILNSIFIPQYGINGAAFASTISYFSAFFIQLLFFIKLHKKYLSEIS